MNPQQQCQSILLTYGEETANKSIEVLLCDPSLNTIKPFIEFLSKTWHDRLVPAMMSLSCQAVEGDPKDTQDIAIALSLMNLSFRTWDDIIDKTLYRKLSPTTVGKFGSNNALIVGGLISAKAFNILNQMKLNSQKRQTINSLLWNYLAKMAEAELIDIKSKSLTYSSKNKFRKIRVEAVNLETCFKIGAITGNGSLKETQELGKYGQYLGIILELWKDIQVSLNLTLELEEKLRSGALPYSFLRAKEKSKKLDKQISFLNKKSKIEPEEIGNVVANLLDTGTIADVQKIIEELTKKAERGINKLKSNKATELLRLFISSQAQIIKELKLP